MSQDASSGRTDSLRATRHLLDDLRALGMVSAPDAIADAALARVGLADWYATVATPLGDVFIAWNAQGLSLVTRADDAPAFREAARALIGRAVAAGEPPERLARGTRAWLAGDQRAALAFDLSRLTPFERAVLMKTREIPHGEVRPYGWIAREIGHAGAVRAVGTALARNPVPLFIPCHRVVRTDGHLGNYSLGGQVAKRTMLTAEGVDVDALERLATRGVRYIASESGDSYCYPTCRYARKINTAHMVSFHDEASAHAAGYHPCHVCRPPEARLAG